MPNTLVNVYHLNILAYLGAAARSQQGPDSRTVSPVTCTGISTEMGMNAMVTLIGKQTLAVPIATNNNHCMHDSICHHHSHSIDPIW